MMAWHRPFSLRGFSEACGSEFVAAPKEDLSATLWPDTFVNLTNLTNVIAEIRKAIGDNDHTVV